jgi:hypothetical protein
MEAALRIDGCIGVVAAIYSCLYKPRSTWTQKDDGVWSNATTRLNTWIRRGGLAVPLLRRTGCLEAMA